MYYTASDSPQNLKDDIKNFLVEYTFFPSSKLIKTKIEIYADQCWVHFYMQ